MSSAIDRTGKRWTSAKAATSSVTRILPPAARWSRAAPTRQIFRFALDGVRAAVCPVVPTFVWLITEMATPILFAAGLACLENYEEPGVLGLSAYPAKSIHCRGATTVAPSRILGKWHGRGTVKLTSRRTVSAILPHDPSPSGRLYRRHRFPARAIAHAQNRVCWQPDIDMPSEEWLVATKCSSACNCVRDYAFFFSLIVRNY